MRTRHSAFENPRVVLRRVLRSLSEENRTSTLLIGTVVLLKKERMEKMSLLGMMYTIFSKKMSAEWTITDTIILSIYFRPYVDMKSVIQVLYNTRALTAYESRAVQAAGALPVLLSFIVDLQLPLLYYCLCVQ